MSLLLATKDGVKARKPHRCCLCGVRIHQGELHDTRRGVSDGAVWTMRMHPECQAYEQKPGTVDPDWYEDISEPAFDRADALADAARSQSKEGTK
jgi:hypothetical protein